MGKASCGGEEGEGAWDATESLFRARSLCPPQTREIDTSLSAPSAQGSEKGQVEQPRKAKKLTMFGRLGAYQRRWGQAAAEATREEADACQCWGCTGEEGLPSPLTDPVGGGGDSPETWVLRRAFLELAGERKEKRVAGE